MKQHHIQRLEQSVENAYKSLPALKNCINAGSSVYANKELTKIRRLLADAIAIIDLQKE